MMKTSLALVWLALGCGKSSPPPKQDELAAETKPVTTIDAAAIASPGSAGARSTPGGSAESIDAAPTAASGSRGPRAVFGKIPDGWSADEDPPNQMTLLVGVNETKFPVDNALFSVRYGLEDADAPVKDPKEYAAWLDKKLKWKAIKTEAVPRGHYFESKDEFRFWLDGQGVRVWCGGSLYKDADYNKIPKIRDQSVAAAKKLCATVTTG
jgi:hypothetical protein